MSPRSIRTTTASGGVIQLLQHSPRGGQVGVVCLAWSWGQNTSNA